MLDSVGEISHFTSRELEKTVSSMWRKKALGPGRIPSEVWETVHQNFPLLLLNMFNVCLALGGFPYHWKVTHLVLVSKGKGNPEHPSSYCPLCMLDSAGKLFKRLGQD